ncbi:MAG: SDR family oxidoreductase [Phycisphaerales bacterium]|nr:SDR family oxidoreductase [Phycisphaerales bacterium]
MTTTRTIIITGASSGIGEATAIRFAQDGAQVVLAARRTDRLADLQRRIEAAGGAALAVTCDVAQRDDVEALARTTIDRFGRIDVLINNAGIMPLAPMVKGRYSDWDDCIDINIKGVLYGIAAVLPTMRAQKTGHIINVSSVAGRKTFPGATVYCATKHAVHTISEGLREELATLGYDDGNRIRVTTIAPGVVTTELPASIRDDETREGASAYYARIPGPLQSEDIAEAIAYAVNAPDHVGVNEILIRPTAQMR